MTSKHSPNMTTHLFTKNKHMWRHEDVTFSTCLSSTDLEVHFCWVKQEIIKKHSAAPMTDLQTEAAIKNPQFIGCPANAAYRQPQKLMSWYTIKTNNQLTPWLAGDEALVNLHECLRSAISANACTPLFNNNTHKRVHSTMDSMTASEAVDPGSTPGGPTILTSGHTTSWP